jgi:hypothetical protein
MSRPQPIVAGRRRYVFTAVRSNSCKADLSAAAVLYFYGFAWSTQHLSRLVFVKLNMYFIPQGSLAETEMSAVTAGHSQ